MQFIDLVPHTGAGRLGLLNKLSQEVKTHRDHLFAPMLSAHDENIYPLLARDPLLFQIATVGSLQPLLDMWFDTYIWWQKVCVEHKRVPIHNWATISLECAGRTPQEAYKIIRTRYQENRDELKFLQAMTLLL